MSEPIDTVKIEVGRRLERWRHCDLHCPRCASPSLYYRAGETLIEVKGSEGGFRYQCGRCGHETIMAPPIADQHYHQRFAALKPHLELAETGGTGAVRVA